MATWEEVLKNNNQAYSMATPAGQAPTITLFPQNYTLPATTTTRAAASYYDIPSTQPAASAPASSSAPTSNSFEANRMAQINAWQNAPAQAPATSGYRATGGAAAQTAPPWHYENGKIVYEQKPGNLDIPEFAAPAWDEKEIAAETQKAAAPGIRDLRDFLAIAQKNMRGTPENKLELVNALSAYGKSLASVMSGAQSRASSVYGAKYQNQYREAEQRQTDLRTEASTAYNAAMSEYLQGGYNPQNNVGEAGFGVNSVVGSDGKPYFTYENGKLVHKV